MSTNKYERFVIYKIYQPEIPEMIYVGGTTNFSQRKSNHKKNTTNRVSKKYHYPLYQYIRNCGGFDKFTIEIVEKCPCKTKMDTLRKEQEIIDFLKPQLNTIKAIKK